LNLLKDLDASAGFNVYIPSLEREVKFKQLTTEQLKLILKTTVGTPLYNTEFILTFNDIIKENCLDQTIDIDNLTVYDKLHILFKTKIESISPDYTIEFSEEEVDAYNIDTNPVVLSVSKQYEAFVEKKINFTEKTFTYNDCIITCNIPTLATESKLESELHTNIDIDTLSNEELQNAIGETFVNEVTKFITSISIKGVGINLLNESFKNRVEVVEKLPTIIINNVLKYIEDYKNTIKQLVIFDINDSLQRELALDASLFNV
jgi:hypothetical protein